MDKNSQTTRQLFALIFVLPVFALNVGCDDGQLPTTADPQAATLDDNSDPQKVRHDLAHSVVDLAHGPADMAHGSGDLGSLPPANPPPTSCDMRSAGVTGIQVVVRIDQYQGLITGSNGVHEIVYGTIIGTPWVFNAKIVDTSNVELALNVKSAKDPTGLPHEVRMSPGQIVEVEGEYIPAATASAHDAHGAAAVIHFSHSPCGYVVIAGTTYK